MSDNLKTISKTERREKRRFDIVRDVKYKVLFGNQLAEVGAGQTLNVSSKGVWFTTETPLSPGLAVELSVSWSALLHDTTAMKLMVFGSVTRVDGRRAGITIERYEFRTQATQPIPVLYPSLQELRLPQ